VIDNTIHIGIGEVPYATNPAYPYPSTTDKLSLWERINSDVIFKAKAVWNFFKPLQDIAGMRKGFGHSHASVDISALYQNRLVLVNSFVGLEVRERNSSFNVSHSPHYVLRSRPDSLSQTSNL
jgi:hypothetical protein